MIGRQTFGLNCQPEKALGYFLERTYSLDESNRLPDWGSPAFNG
jgi:hypothetical protein